MYIAGNVSLFLSDTVDWLFAILLSDRRMLLYTTQSSAYLKMDIWHHADTDRLSSLINIRRKQPFLACHNPCTF